MSLEIVIRTCDTAQVHNDWRVRYCNLDKPTITKGCFQSIVNACKHIQNYKHKITILDDHSSNETLSFINKKLKEIDITHEIVNLSGRGYNNSAVVQFEKCRDSEYDLVYSIEDDYLHEPTSLIEMIESFNIFEKKLIDKSIVLYPFDEPSEYSNPYRADYIVHGSRRHWRTGIFTTQVLFCRPSIFKTNWDLFYLLASKYNGDYLNPRKEDYNEMNTIWNIWSNSNSKTIRFNPIPSLALHLQFEDNKDPFINWEKWWEKYTK